MLRKQEREELARILMAITALEAAVAELQETIDTEREAMRRAIEESVSGQ